MKKKIIWTVSALALMAVIIICGYHWGQANALPGNPDATNEVMYSGGETTSPTDGTEETKWYEGGNGEEIVITMPPSDGGEDIIPPGWEDDDTPVSDATQPPKQDDTPVKQTTPPATEPPVTEAPVTAPPVTQPPATEPEEPKPVSTGKVNFTDVSEAVRTTGYVNVRSGPGSSYKKLDSLPDNYSLLRTGVGDNGWSRVIYNGKEAYISTNYLLFEEECDYGPDELLEMYPLERCLCDIVLAESRYCPAFCEGPANWYVRCQNGHRMYLTIPGSEPVGHSFANGFCTVCDKPDPTHPAGAKYLADRDKTNYVAIGQAATKYINEYRLAEGSTELIWLPGLSEVAQYRTTLEPSGHDTAAMREALAHFQYGRYVELSDGSGYWSFEGGEAYAWNVGGETIDDVGKRIADIFHNSPGHWAYVGSSEYSYIGIGYTQPGCGSDTYLWVGTVNYG